MPSAENDPYTNPEPRNPGASPARVVGATVGGGLLVALAIVVGDALDAALGAGLGGAVRLKQKKTRGGQKQGLSRVAGKHVLLTRLFPDNERMMIQP